MEQVEINKSIKLSEHFSLGELTVTNVKTADGNIPSHVAIENLKRLCKWLEALRAQYNLRYSDGHHLIQINSGYRSEAVNKKVGVLPTVIISLAVRRIFGCMASSRHCAMLSFF